MNKKLNIAIKKKIVITFTNIFLFLFLKTHFSAEGQVYSQGSNSHGKLGLGIDSKDIQFTNSPSFVRSLEK